MKELILKFYQCEFCNVTDASSIYIEKHEAICVLNPILKGCHTCENGILDYDRQDYPIVRCKNSDKKNLVDCSDWGLSKGNKRIISEFTASNAQSLCNYIKG